MTDTRKYVVLVFVAWMYVCHAACVNAETFTRCLAPPSIQPTVSRTNSDTPAALTFVQATEADLETTHAAYTEIWGKDSGVQLTREQMRNTIEQGLAYLLKTDDAQQELLGVLLTYRLHTGGNLDLVIRTPMWTNLIQAQGADPNGDTVIFWSIGTLKAARGKRFGGKFATLALECFNDVPYIATFSPITSHTYDVFVTNLRNTGVAEEVIDTHGIYLYLATVNDDLKLIDLTSRFHAQNNGAKFGLVIPEKVGSTRPPGGIETTMPYTITYIYKGFESYAAGFSRRLSQAFRALRDTVDFHELRTMITNSVGLAGMKQQIKAIESL